MRTHARTNTLVVLTVLVTWFFPGTGPARAAEPGPQPPPVAAAPGPRVPARAPAGQPATAAETESYAERERQSGALADFEAGARISTTTIIIILLVVIILILLL
jgi:hypothetical protein